MLLGAAANRVQGHLEALQRGWALRILRGKREAEWLRLNERLTLEAFRRSARRVPAYRRLLEQRGVDAARILTLEDFRTRVPFSTRPPSLGRAIWPTGAWRVTSPARRRS